MTTDELAKLDDCELDGMAAKIMGFNESIPRRFERGTRVTKRNGWIYTWFPSSDAGHAIELAEKVCGESMPWSYTRSASGGSYVCCGTEGFRCEDSFSRSLTIAAIAAAEASK